MFPSGGYFRSANCPFYQHGLCHRPYCHFRHTVPDYKPTVALNSKKSEEQKKDPVVKHTHNHGEDVKQQKKDLVLKGTQEKTKTTKNKHNVEVKTSNQPIFKRTALEEKLIAFSANTDMILTDSDSDADTPSKQNDDNQSTVSKPQLLPCEEKGKSFQNNSVKGSSCTIDMTTSSVSTYKSTEVISDDKMLAICEKLEEKDKPKAIVISDSEDELLQEIKDENNDRLSNACKESRTKEILELPPKSSVGMTMNYSETCDEIFVDTEELHENKTGKPNEKIEEQVKGLQGKKLIVMIEDLQNCGAGSHFILKSTKEDAKIKKSKKKEKNKPDSSKLADVDFFAADVSKLKKKMTAKEGKHVEKSKHKIISESDKKKMKKKLGESNLAPVKEKSKIQRYKELKRLFKDSENTLDKLEDQQKKSLLVDNKFVATLEKEKETIRPSDFLLKKPKHSWKNESKGFKKDKDDSKSNVHNNADETTEEKQSSKNPFVLVAPDKKVILIPDNDTVCENSQYADALGTSDTNRHSDYSGLDEDSEENELLRIFNDYNPDNDEPEMNDCVDDLLINIDVVNVRDSDDKKEKKLVQSSKSISGLKRQSSEGTSAAFKKQRVAHQPNLVITRTPQFRNNTSTFYRHLPRPLQGTLAPPPRPKIQATSQGEKDLVTSTHVKQRVTHFTKGSGILTQRPRIRLEYGAKVPQSVRQKYLDKIVDEYLCFYKDQQEAFDKAEKEEKQVYLKSPRRQVYINLCVNLIKKLRDSLEKLNEDIRQRNPLASKSTLPPSPSKRAKVDSLTTARIARQDFEEQNDSSEKAVKNNGGMTEEEFYTRMHKYVMTKEELEGNAFPRPSSVPGRAEVTDCYSKIKRNPSDSTRHICCRCGKAFVILESGEYPHKEECVYHHGRLIRSRTAGEIVTSYTCCQGESGCIGCCVAKAHVRATYWSEETGFVVTRKNPNSYRKKIYALDCEMCYTTKGLELTRVTVVDYNGQQVYDTLVKPKNDIIDYNTRFSGITEESMIGVAMTLRDVQSVLLNLFYEDTILIGHSLESDLRSLKIIHSTVVDTSIVFPHRLGLPYKRALKTLMAEYVRKIIQDSEEGHDSLEDAVSCIELMLWRVKEDMKYKQSKK